MNTRDIGATFLQQIPPAARLLTQLLLRSHHWWPCQLQQRRLSRSVPSPKRSRPPWLRRRPRRGRTGWNGWNGWVVQDFTPWKSWMDGTSQKWRFGSDDNLRLSSAQVIFGGGFARRFIFWGVLEERLLSVLGHWKRKDKGEVLLVILAGSLDLFSLVSTLQEMITYPNSQLIWKGNIIFKIAFSGDMLVPRRANEWTRAMSDAKKSIFFRHFSAHSSRNLNFQLYKKHLTVRGNPSPKMRTSIWWNIHGEVDPWRFLRGAAMIWSKFHMVFTTNMLSYWDSVTFQGAQKRQNLRIRCTVDAWNPKQPPGMVQKPYESSGIIIILGTLVVQDLVHQHSINSMSTKNLPACASLSLKEVIQLRTDLPLWLQGIGGGW